MVNKYNNIQFCFTRGISSKNKILRMMIMEQMQWVGMMITALRLLEKKWWPSTWSTLKHVFKVFMILTR